MVDVKALQYLVRDPNLEWGPARQGAYLKFRIQNRSCLEAN